MLDRPCLVERLYDEPQPGLATVDGERGGDSVLAGFASGGLVRKGRMGQRDSAPVLIARMGGAKLALPSMSAPGFPPPLVIADRNRRKKRSSPSA